MNSERNPRSTSNLVEEKRGSVKSWSELSHHLPEDIDPNVTRYIRGYFRAQLHIVEGKKTKARNLFNGLEKVEGFLNLKKIISDFWQQLILLSEVLPIGHSRRNLL